MSGCFPFAKEVNNKTIQEIAQTPEARFDWYIQKEFKVLPTDPRFTDLTEEQKSLIFEHIKLDNPEKFKPDNKIRDAEYDEVAEDVEESEEGIAKPIPEGGYVDPEFDDLWENDQEISTDNLPENDSSELSNGFDSIPETESKHDIDEYNDDDWEEV